MLLSSLRHRSGLLLLGLLVAYVIGLTTRSGDGFSVLVDGWLGILTQLVPAAVCWGAVRRVGGRRLEVLLAAGGVTCFALGNTYYVLAVATGVELPYPSPADAGYLLFYPLVLGALAVQVRRDLRRTTTLWLDSALGSLGAASVLAVLLHPILRSSLADGLSLTAVTAVSYPLFDLLLVSAVAGIAVVRGRRGNRHWLVLSSGLLVFTVSDVVYAFRVAQDTYVVGTPLDAGWAVGLSLVALGVIGLSRQPREQSEPSAKGAVLAVPALSTAAALAVLVAGTRTPVSGLAVGLAGVTVLAAVVRTQLAFRQLVSMAVLRQQATTDDLTGLPNRRALYASVARSLSTPSGDQQALLLLDLDRFKEVNDSLGHHVGDRLLMVVGERLRRTLRSRDVLARLGGDEFAVLLEDTDEHEAAAVAIKLREALAEPFTLEGIALQTGVSIGIALHPQHGQDLNALLRRADIAMYRAKADRDGHHVYSGSDDAHGALRLRTLNELGAAITDGQLVLHYQPKIDLETGAVRGVEALVRWQHPERGLLYPDAFLTMVEESGLMRQLTQDVLEQALDQAAEWQQAGRVLTVAVNLSASSLMDAHLPEEVLAMLTSRGLPASSLQLEITEEFLMADRDRARAVLTRLRRSGIQIAVDDFGTGYSSLAYLRDLPVDELKLDRSFITPMAEDDRAAALVASTIGLAHSLGLRMVAEGVEDQVTYDELRRLGCDEAQGYHLSRPVPADELDLWLRAADQRRHGSTPAQRAPVRR